MPTTTTDRLDKPEYYYQAVRSDILHLVEPTGKRILDVGCGDGGTALALKEAGAIEAVGVEYIPSSAERAAQVLDLVLTGDIATIPLDFPNGHFDVILCLDVLEHLAYPEVALARLAPLLSPTGCLIVSVPNIRYIGTLKQLIFNADWPRETSGVFDGTHLRWFTPKSMRRYLSDAGLSVVQMERHAARPFTGLAERIPAVAKILPDWFTCQFVYKAVKA